MKTKINLFTAVFAAVLIVLTGCTKQEQKTEGDKKKDSISQVDKNKNQVAGDNKTSTNTEGKPNELGIKEGLPADYPADIPQPANSKCLGSLNTSEGTVVTFESTDKPKVILAAFSEGVDKAGFKKSDGEMMSEDGGLSMWTKDKRDVSIMLAWDKDKNNSSVVITYK
ncbi:MAG: hypothetical protein IT281_09400 [Ignavibacteria bacterium]|nr:hypothetical protein [Ignavibacteria bacterium]MCC7159741.1 hypothetical protein [Ignavibacteria bacterium]